MDIYSATCRIIGKHGCEILNAPRRFAMLLMGFADVSSAERYVLCEGFDDKLERGKEYQELVRHVSSEGVATLYGNGSTALGCAQAMVDAHPEMDINVVFSILYVIVRSASDFNVQTRGGMSQLENRMELDTRELISEVVASLYEGDCVSTSSPPITNKDNAWHWALKRIRFYRGMMSSDQLQVLERNVIINIFDSYLAHFDEWIEFVDDIKPVLDISEVLIESNRIDFTRHAGALLEPYVSYVISNKAQLLDGRVCCKSSYDSYFMLSDFPEMTKMPHTRKIMYVSLCSIAERSMVVIMPISL